MEWLEKGNEVFIPVFKRLPVEIDYGDGVYLFDRSGKKYLDFFSGLGVNALGYRHPRIMAAIGKQLNRNLHLSNFFLQDIQFQLAEKILQFSRYARLFFTNSGAESIEGILKLVKKWANGNGKDHIICFKNAFHGRTLGALSVTAQNKYQKSFLPLLSGMVQLDYNDSEQLLQTANEKTAAIIIEFIQGEGGVLPVTPQFVQALLEVKRQYNVIIIADEIQTGIGRTGEFLSFQHFDIQPDMTAIAKAIGGGLPLGAFLVDEKFIDILSPGEHGTTFGGNPLSCAAGLAVMEEIEQTDLMEQVKSNGEYLSKSLMALKTQYPDKVIDVRGMGLMQGMVLRMDGFPLVLKGLEEGIILNCTAGNILRFLPPLIIQKDEIDRGVEILSGLLKNA